MIFFKFAYFSTAPAQEVLLWNFGDHVVWWHLRCASDWCSEDILLARIN